MRETTAPTSPQIAASAEVDVSAVLGPGTRVRSLAQVREGARLYREQDGCLQEEQVP